VNATCVITSIFPPTASVASFAGSVSFTNVIVVGDRKSPPGYPLDGVRFLSVSDQEQLPWGLLGQLPFNHYCRKMVGYLEAAASGADILFDTDDDNGLLPGVDGAIWAIDCLHELRPGGDETRHLNVYRHFSDQPIWPRGLPLDLITASHAEPPLLAEAPRGVSIGVWQGLANGDPDVDAIYRLTSNQPCTFLDRPAVSLPEGIVCPFNSQNTAFRRELLPLMYLPAYVTFRYTDILRGLVAQPILWAAGLRLAFTPATVFQDRNAHDYLRDLESEVPMYLTGRRALELAIETASASRSIPENLQAVYEALEREGIVEARELELLGLWLADCAQALTLGN
jgi:hypothetical protein